MSEPTEFKLSEEQSYIFTALSRCNVYVDAVAGSGKTTTILNLAKSRRNDNILMLTYNNKLRAETALKADKMNITNITIHTYHSFFHSTKMPCYNDILMHTILNDIDASKKQFAYDIIIIDEVQDMKFLLYRAAKVIYTCNFSSKYKNAKLCVLGDKNQNIYSYQGADHRFLTLAPDIFNWNSYEWKYCTLSISFRMTKSIATFVNKCVLKENRIKSPNGNDGVKDDTCYITQNLYSTDGFNEIAKYIDSVLIKTLNFKTSEIAVLAYSIKSLTQGITSKVKFNLMLIANALSEYGHSIYYPDNDTEESANEKLLKHKILFSSFHQAKGIEREAIVLVGFDDGLSNMSNDFVSPICPNILYVATTRAKKKMVIFHNVNNDFLNCIDKRRLGIYGNVITQGMQFEKSLKKKVMTNDGKYIYVWLTEKYNPFSDPTVFNLNKAILVNEMKNGSVVLKSEEVKARNPISIREAINKLQYEELLELNEYINVKLIKQGNKSLMISNTTKQIDDNDLDIYENVADIIGIILPMMFEYITYNKITLLELKEAGVFTSYNLYKETPKHNVSFNTAEELFTKYESRQNFTIEEYTTIALRLNHASNQKNYVFKQIKNRKLINTSQIDEVIRRFSNLKLINPTFEHFIQSSNSTLCNGYIDCIDNTNIYEFKNTINYKFEYAIQLAFYMCNLPNYETYKYYIYNVYDDSLREISVEQDNVSKIMDVLNRVANSQNKTTDPIDDVTFIKKCKDTM